MYVLLLKTDISVTAAAAVTTEVSIFSVRGLESDNGGLRGGFTARSPLSVAGEGPPPPAALPRPPPLTGVVGSGGGDRMLPHGV